MSDVPTGLSGMPFVRWDCVKSRFDDANTEMFIKHGCA